MALLCLGLLAGCQLQQNYFARPDKAKPMQGEVCEILPIWQHGVSWAPDVTRGGNPVPCISGTVYLLGRDSGFPVECNGSMTVTLYDDTTPGQSGLLGQWTLEKETLKKVLTPDTTMSFGWGYRLVLPWPNYRPEISRVHMRIAVNNDKAPPLYRDGSVIALGDAPQTHLSNSTAVLGNAKQPGAVARNPGTRQPSATGSTDPSGLVQTSAFGSTMPAPAVPQAPALRKTDIPVAPRGERPAADVPARTEVPQGSISRIPSARSAPPPSPPEQPVDLVDGADAVPMTPPAAPVSQGSGSSGVHRLTIQGGIERPVMWPPSGAQR